METSFNNKATKSQTLLQRWVTLSWTQFSGICQLYMVEHSELLRPPEGQNHFWPHYSCRTEKWLCRGKYSKRSWQDSVENLRCWEKGTAVSTNQKGHDGHTAGPRLVWEYCEQYQTWPTFVAVFAMVIWLLPNLICGLWLVHKPWKE